MNRRATRRTTRACTSPIRAFAWVMSTIGVLVGCAHSKVLVVEPPAKRFVPEQTLLAGAAEADITPGFGVPLFGYSWDAATHASGVWTRLKARVLALQDSRGERLALVQADLGAVSGLMHRRVAENTAVIGITADRLVIAATHTHAGPGGYFGEEFFNYFGSGKIGYDPVLVDDLVSRIGDAVHRAFTDLRPAALGSAEVDVPEVTHNRSLPAWQKNPGAGTSIVASVDTKLRLLRVDRFERSDPTKAAPLAALFVFAVHGTAMPQSNRLYHGDLHAVAAREFKYQLDHAKRGSAPVIAAFMNGAEGDVGPCPEMKGRVPHGPLERICQEIAQSNKSVSDRTRAQGETLAIEMGKAIATKAVEAYELAKGQLDHDPRITHAYREVELPGTQTASGRVCQKAKVGVATIGGAEDGRSPLYGHFGVYEGNSRSDPDPGDCQRPKKSAGGFVQTVLLGRQYAAGGSLAQFFGGDYDPGAYPRIAPFQVIGLGNAMVLAMVPGEPTTEVGRRIRARVQKHWLRKAESDAPVSPPVVAVVGLANDYFYYFTTPGEFDAQHYEGASTLYGPFEGVAAEEQLELLARSLDQKDAGGYSVQRGFLPGPASHLQYAGECPTNDWGLVGNGEPSRTHDGKFVSMTFRGPRNGQDCGGFPRARIVCTSASESSIDNTLDDDEGYRLMVSKMPAVCDSGLWQVRWRIPEGLPETKSRCYVQIRKNRQQYFNSKEFKL